MANYCGKQPSCRPIVYQALGIHRKRHLRSVHHSRRTTVQVRVCSEAQGWLPFDGSAVSATSRRPA